MPKQNYIGLGCHGGTHDIAKRHRTKFGIDERNVMTVVDKRAADGQESERRQLLARDATADRWMRRIDNQETHASPGNVGGLADHFRINEIPQRP